MKTATRLLLAAATLALSLQSTAAEVGFSQLTLHPTHHQEPLPVSLWYPAQTNGQTDVIGHNPIMPGTPIRRDASITEGKHPLVILSHGSGGLPDNLGWFAGALAEAGYLVAAPKHPGSSFGSYDLQRVLRLDNRQLDLATVLDRLLEDYADSIDADSISAVGFSLGGQAVLSSVGAAPRLDRYQQYCQDLSSLDCGWWQQVGLNLTQVPAEHFNIRFNDPRIKRVVAIDPGMAQAFDPASLKAIDRPVLLLNLGDHETIFPGIDVRPLAQAIPGSKQRRIAKATHFSFLGECLPHGPAILAEEGEEPICTDGEGGDRRVIHQQILQQVLPFLAQR